MADFAPEDRDPDRRPGPAGPPVAGLRDSRHALRQRQPHPATVSRRPRAGDVRPGLLLGRRARVLGGAGRLRDRRRLCRGPHAQSDLRGGLLRLYRPQRGGDGVVRPGEDILRGAAASVLGEPRPDPGHAPGQRCRHAVSLGPLHLFGGAEDAGPGVARDLPEGTRAEGLRRDHDRDRRGPGVLLRRGLSPAVSRQEPRRLLRPGRHRRVVPHRAGRRGGI